MADKSLIEWTDATWNPITGCSVVSPGCTHCYAMKLAGGRLKHHPTRAGLTQDSKGGPVWTGEVRFNDKMLLEPLRWSKPRRIFVCAHGDLFAEGVPDEWIDKVFAVMALCSQHTFQVLTKRPERMREYLTFRNRHEVGRHLYVIDAAQKLEPIHWPRLLHGSRWPLVQVWLGVSAEDQKRADERIPVLLDTPAAKRFVSLEPLLGPITLLSTLGGTLWIGGQRGHGGQHYGVGTTDCPRELHHHHDERCEFGLDWVIVGGESGTDARSMHPDWVRSLRDQCKAAGVPFFFKQWGAWVPCDPDSEHTRGNPRSGWKAFRQEGPIPRHDELLPQNGAAHVAYVGKKVAGRLLDGVEHNGMPGAPEAVGRSGALPATDRTERGATK